MAKRIIAAISAVYGDENERMQSAVQGQEVDLTPEQEKLLDEQRALVPEGHESFQAFSDLKFDAYRAGRGDVEAAGRLAEARSGGIVNLSAPLGPTTSAADLAAYLRDEKPSAADTVALADGDPEKAVKVLDAERSATGGKPRAAVEKPLTALIEKD